MDEVLCIRTDDVDQDILRRLLKLYQEDKYEKIKEVSTEGECWDDDNPCMFTDNVVSDIVRAFRHISSKGITWDLLSVHECDQENHVLQSLLSQICKLDLFRRIEVDQEEGGVAEQMAGFCMDAMKNNSKLENLYIDNFRLSTTSSSLLCEGLKARDQTLTELSFRNLSFQ